MRIRLCCWASVAQAVRSVSRSSFIVFSTNLVNSKAVYSSRERCSVYITCGRSVLAGEYESVAITSFQRWVPVSSNCARSSACKLLVATCVAVWGASSNARFNAFISSTKTFITIVYTYVYRRKNASCAMHKTQFIPAPKCSPAAQ